MRSRAHTSSGMSSLSDTRASLAACPGSRCVAASGPRARDVVYPPPPAHGLSPDIYRPVKKWGAARRRPGGWSIEPDAWRADAAQLPTCRWAQGRPLCRAPRGTDSPGSRWSAPDRACAHDRDRARGSAKMRVLVIPGTYGPKASAEPRGDLRGEPHREPGCDPHGDPRGEPHREPGCDPHGDPRGKPHREPGCDPHGDPRGKPQREPRRDLWVDGVLGSSWPRPGPHGLRNGALRRLEAPETVFEGAFGPESGQVGSRFEWNRLLGEPDPEDGWCCPREGGRASRPSQLDARRGHGACRTRAGCRPDAGRRYIVGMVAIDRAGAGPPARACWAPARAVSSSLGSPASVRDLGALRRRPHAVDAEAARTRRQRADVLRAVLVGRSRATDEAGQSLRPLHDARGDARTMLGRCAGRCSDDARGDARTMRGTDRGTMHGMDRGTMRGAVRGTDRVAVRGAIRGAMRGAMRTACRHTRSRRQVVVDQRYPARSQSWIGATTPDRFGWGRVARVMSRWSSGPLPSLRRGADQKSPEMAQWRTVGPESIQTSPRVEPDSHQRATRTAPEDDQSRARLKPEVHQTSARAVPEPHQSRAGRGPGRSRGPAGARPGANRGLCGARTAESADALAPFGVPGPVDDVEPGRPILVAGSTSVEGDR